MKVEITNTINRAFSGFSTPNFSTPLVLPTADPNALGGQNNPIPVGQPLVTNWESMTLLKLERPSQFIFAYSFDTEVQPANGADYVGLKIEFECPQTQVTCYSATGDLTLLLTDGRLVPQISSDIYPQKNPLKDQSLVGGRKVEVWRFFEVPKRTIIQAAKLSNYASDAGVWGLVPNT